MSTDTTCRVDYTRANYTPFYLMANVRGIASAEFRRAQNWVLAMRLFAVGSTTAWAICKEAGIDPEATEVRKVAEIGKHSAPSGSGRKG